MNFNETLVKTAEQRGSIVCMGLDPVIEAMPSSFSERGIEGVVPFFESILEEMCRQGVYPGAFKPNAGFFLKHDEAISHRHFLGSEALSRVITIFGDLKIPIILDYKRGDIAKSSLNYAHEGFGSWNADAVTVSPYMGSDSVGPFIETAMPRGGGVYILNRTSNPGAKDFQNLLVIKDKRLYEELSNLTPERSSVVGVDSYIVKALKNGITPLYMAVAEKIVEWATGNPGVGAVVGATSLPELEKLAKFYVESERRIPLMIPGVGGQGGKADEVVRVLGDAGYDLSIVRINSSSDITHPWAKEKRAAPADYAKVCVANLAKLNETIAYNP
ncbi:MAG: orotidine-5'-phosphate decarboxylase [archaeon]